MIVVERLHGADRKADAVEGERIVHAQPAELGTRWAAGAHVILRMDLEETDGLRSGEDIG